MHPATRVIALALVAAFALAASAAASVQSELAFHRGVVAYGEDDLATARAQFEKVLQEDAEDTVALHYLGLIAQKQGDTDGALAWYDRALAVDPEDPEVLIDRGIALLDVERLPEARESFQQALALEPDNPRALMFEGIAAYRMGKYSEARPNLDRAAELDPSLRTQSRYYSGLSEAFAGNLTEAGAAFSDVEQQSPIGPMGQSAANLRQQIEEAEQPRPWSASMTAGMEYDSNPLIVGGGTPFASRDPDGRGVLRPRASYRFLQREDWSLAAGYDGFFSFHIYENQVNLQTHAAWLSGGYNLGIARLGLRYDVAYTMIDTTKRFRLLNQVTPSVSVRQSDWGLTYAYYQYQYDDFRKSRINPLYLNRDGDRHLGGINQFFFLPEPFTYVRLGMMGDRLDTKGSEWSYTGWEASMGSAYNFDYDIGFTWLYRFVWRDYDNASFFSIPQFTRTRDDRRHVLSLDLSKGITEHWLVSVAASLTWSSSNVPFYDYNRQVAGAYATYRF